MPALEHEVVATDEISHQFLVEYFRNNTLKFLESSIDASSVACHHSAITCN